MLLQTSFVFNKQKFIFPLDTEDFDRNYDDEPYAYWIKESRDHFFEINIAKTEEVDGELTKEGWVKCYETEGDFEDDNEVEMFDITFEELTLDDKQIKENDTTKSAVLETLQEIKEDKKLMSLLERNVLELRAEIYPHYEYEYEHLNRMGHFDEDDDEVTIDDIISFVEDCNYYPAVFIDGINDKCLNILDL